MAPTSDAPREVAKRLREFADTDVWLSEIFSVWEKFVDTDRPSADILADLIDPITTVELRAPWTIYRKCGARMEGYQHKPVRFCPHCGRRIVR